MVALMKVYEEEDEAYQDLVTMATQFYQYLLQPFRDMRELATLYKLEILVSLPLQSERPSYIVGHQLLLEELGLKSHNIPYFFLSVPAFFSSAKPPDVTDKFGVREEALSGDLGVHGNGLTRAAADFSPCQ